MTGPRVVLTLLVRDEVDVVADMLLWHLSHGVDHVIAMDNASTDGTTEILEDLAATGALTLIHQPSDAYLQDVWTTEMAHIARNEHAADWVIPSDADEFWMATGEGDLKDALADISRDVDLVRCPRVNLMGSREDLNALDWPDALVWRADPELALTDERRADPAPFDPPFIYYGLPSKLIANPERLVAVHRGAHNARFDGGPVEGPEPSICVYHVPFRDESEFLLSTARIANGVERDERSGPHTSWKSRRWNRMPPEEAYAEVLPDADRLQTDIRAGRARLETSLREVVSTTRSRLAPQMALYGVTRRPARPHRDALSPPVPLLVVGDDRIAVSQVTDRLQRAGARRPPAPGDQDLHSRIEALHLARSAAPDDSTAATATKAEIRNTLERLGSGGHGAVISDSRLAENLDLWSDLAHEGHVAPAIIFVIEGGWNGRLPVTSSQSLAEAAATTADLSSLIVSPPRLLSASPQALHRTIAALGLWLPLSIARDDT